MATAAEFIEKMNDRFDPAAAQGENIVFQFNIEDQGTYHLTIKDGTCGMADGEAADPNVTLSMNSETLQKLASGELDGMMAFMSGKIKVDGDLNAVMKFQSLVGL